MQLQKTESKELTKTSLLCPEHENRICWNSIAGTTGDLPSPKRTRCKGKGKEAIRTTTTTNDTVGMSLPFANL